MVQGGGDCPLAVSRQAVCGKRLLGCMLFEGACAAAAAL